MGTSRKKLCSPAMARILYLAGKWLKWKTYIREFKEKSIKFRMNETSSNERYWCFCGRNFRISWGSGRWRESQSKFVMIGEWTGAWMAISNAWAAIFYSKCPWQKIKTEHLWLAWSPFLFAHNPLKSSENRELVLRILMSFSRYCSHQSCYFFFSPPIEEMISLSSQFHKNWNNNWSKIPFLSIKAHEAVRVMKVIKWVCT